jgi:DNA invertase Pin-like site-specific DNA recombinase
MRLLPRCPVCHLKRCRCLQQTPRTHTASNSRRPVETCGPPDAPGDLISYLRVSTGEQGISGLGLEAQRAAVGAYCQQTGKSIAREYVEIMSGKRSDNRPELAAALAHCRRTGSTLVIARIDRLARNVAFVAALMDSGVQFIALDCPGADRFTLHVLAALADAEGRAISIRTRAALSAAKARGTLLGTHRPGSRPLSPEAMDKGRAVCSANRRKAQNRAAGSILPELIVLRRQGLTLSQCAEILNKSGKPTSTGGKWGKSQLHRILRRYGIANSVSTGPG